MRSPRKLSTGNRFFIAILAAVVSAPLAAMAAPPAATKPATPSAPRPVLVILVGADGKVVHRYSPGIQSAETILPGIREKSGR